MPIVKSTDKLKAGYITKILPSGFTERQEEIRKLLAEGLTHRKIAEKFGCSIAAVRGAISSIRVKEFRISQGKPPRKPHPNTKPKIGSVPVKDTFEDIQRSLLIELRKRTKNDELRSQLSTDELGTMLKICRENIAQEIEYSDMPDGKPLELIHNMPMEEDGGEKVQ